MPKQGQRAEINTFIQGLITEASPLNFPPNASRDEENFILKRDGTRHRRLGIEYEENNSVQAETILLADLPTTGINAYRWEQVEGVVDRNILVVQTGRNLTFYNLSDLAFSASILGTLNFFSVIPATKYSFATIDGKLVVATGASNIFTVSYVEGVFTYTDNSIKVRDLWGMEESPVYEGDVFHRDAEFDAAHHYNLQNQSWGLPRKNKEGVLLDPVKIYFDTYYVYPSSSEVVWTGLHHQPVQIDAEPFERIYPQQYEEVRGMGIQAAKGYFIIDLLNRGNSRLLQTQANTNRNPALYFHDYATPVMDRTTGGASVVASYAGRVFFAGFNGQNEGGDKRSPNLTNCVVFSQIVNKPADIYKCYQEGDPTSRDGSDIVDSDGGFLRVSGANQILSMQPVSSGLLVIADNGVWMISGGADYGFSATNYKVSRLTDLGCVSAASVVMYNSQVFYWGVSGICVAMKDKFGEYGVQNITQTTIQSLYDDIPLESKMKCVGLFEEDTKKVVWMYRTGTPFTGDSITKELSFDTTLTNFCINRISRTPDNKIEVFCPVYHKKLYYLTGYRDDAFAQVQFTFSHYHQKEFLDWKAHDGVGVDAKAFLLTGSQIAGDSSIVKQTPYLTMHFRKTEFEADAFGVPKNQSSCLYRTQWDWATGVQSNKFSTLAQAYKYRKAFHVNLEDNSYDNGFETVTSKNKIRGRGRAFALYLETEPLKDCNILGWNLTINGNALA